MKNLIAVLCLVSLPGCSRDSVEGSVPFPIGGWCCTYVDGLLIMSLGGTQFGGYVQFCDSGDVWFKMTGKTIDGRQMTPSVRAWGKWNEHEKGFHIKTPHPSAAYTFEGLFYSDGDTTRFNIYERENIPKLGAVPRFQGVAERCVEQLPCAPFAADAGASDLSRDGPASD